MKNNFSSSSEIFAVPYRGYVNDKRLYIKGRVLEKKDISEKEGEGKLRNFIDSVRRFNTDEIEGAKVSLQIENHLFETFTDCEGYFEIDEPWQTSINPSENQWIDATVKLLEVPKHGPSPDSFPAELLVPSKAADFGIISDIDDTVLQTHMTSRLMLKMIYTTFLKDSHQRKPMEGMLELLNAFVSGKSGAKENPIFYVSDSPWNLYDLLIHFMENQKLPKGPILLRDYGVHMLKRWKKRPVHKLDSFRHILGKYPDLPFVMLGDTASKDADYYVQMAKEFNGRIQAIYIRQTKNNRNARRVCKLIRANSGINAVIVKSSKEIKEHARKIGLIK